MARIDEDQQVELGCIIREVRLIVWMLSFCPHLNVMWPW